MPSRKLAHLLHKAYNLNPELTAKDLTELAENRRAPGPKRIEAVEIAGPTLGRQQTIELHFDHRANRRHRLEPDRDPQRFW